MNGQVTDEIKISDMDFEEESDTFSSNCRCSGNYIISSIEIQKGFTIVQCSSCSLCIKIVGL